MGVHRLGIEIGDQAVPFAYHCGLQECYGLSRQLGSKLDSWMKRVDFLKKLPQFLLAVWRDGKYVIYVPPPDSRSVGDLI